MPGFVSDNAFLSIGGTDLSDHVEELELTWEADAVEDTRMGHTVHSNIGGLNVIGLSVRVQQDDAASEVSATLFPLVGTRVAVIVRPDAGAVSATNPQYSTTLLLTSVPLVSGAVGELSKAELGFAPAGVTLSRTTS